MASTPFTYILGGPGVATVWVKAANAATTVAKVLRVTNTTSLVPDANGVWTITPTNEEDTAAFYAFLDAALPVGTASIAEASRTRESGTVVGGGVSGGTEYILGVAGAKGNKGTDDVRKLGIFNVSVSGDSGGYTQTAGASTTPSIKFVSTTVATATTVGFALIDEMPNDVGTASSLFLKASGSETIPVGRSHKISFVTAAA